MAFRSNQDAALARADALQRQLDEEKGALAATRAELDDTVAKLAAARAEAAAAAKKADESGKKKKRDAKKAKDRAAIQSQQDRPVAKRQPKSVLRRDEQKEEDKRLRDSLGWFDFQVFALFMVFSPLFTYRILGYFHTLLDGVAASLAIGGVASVLAALLAAYLYNYSTKKRFASGKQWASNLPFRLPTYPQVLKCRPASQPYGGEGHEVMLVTLNFSDEAPWDLAETLQAFDGKLVEGSDGRFARNTPVTSYVRFGTRCYPDSNKALRRWIKRFAKNALAPLSKQHGLTSVLITLTSRQDTCDGDS